MIRTLIVDDEALARSKIRTLLKSEPDFTIVGECENGAQAIESLRSLSPDVLFLDIQMPDQSGLEIIKNGLFDHLPLIVFVTAYDQYALPAFDLRATDYLLKPFKKTRFQQTLHHLRKQLNSQSSSSLQPNSNRPPDPDQRFAIKDSGRILFLKLDEIDYIESASNYALFHVGKQTFIHRETLQHLITRFHPKQFIQINRSTIINIQRIQEIKTQTGSNPLVLLSNGSSFQATRDLRSLY